MFIIAAYKLSFINLLLILVTKTHIEGRSCWLLVLGYKHLVLVLTTEAKTLII